MKSIKLFLLLFVAIHLSSCKDKEDPVPESLKSVPEFYITGTLGNTVVKLNAGENDFYMNTRDTFFGAPLSTYKFYGEFAPLGCRKCNNTFGFTFNDFKANTNGSPSYIDSVLVAGKKLPYSRPSNPSYGRAFVSWIDENGTFYHTESNKQPAANRFTIESVEEYNPNLNGRKTKKIKATFSCRLYTPQGDSLDFINVETVFAVSYP